ncbi:MAG: stage III sporulation protein AA [Desulfitobacterium sp.]|nr:stage III sporulation protein AA [Desulfitobacterium sp.]
MSLRYTIHPIHKNPVPKDIASGSLKAKKPNLQGSKDILRTLDQRKLEDSILRWLGEGIAGILRATRTVNFQDVEEIRLRIAKPLLLAGRREFFLDERGAVVPPEKGYKVRREDIFQALERMTQSSLYAAEEEMRQGFITLPGGHRVGMTGEAMLKKGEIQSLKHISALNIRLAKAIPGIGEKILANLIRRDGSLYHTLIISPPRGGKTTLLRDLIRRISEGSEILKLQGQTVGVVDERKELAGMWQGVPAYDLGCRTDVLDGCPKRIGITMLVRSMAPQVVAVDELGHTEDGEAVLDALRTGVKILSTAHASTLEEALGRPSLKELFAQGTFERVVILSRRQGPGTIEEIVDLEKFRKSGMGKVGM